MAYLLTEPKSGTYMGLNPFSDPTFWEMTTPEGLQIKANGRLGMARVTARPKEGKIWIDYDAGVQASRMDIASSLLVFGAKSLPIVELNGSVIKVESQQIGDQTAYVIPLDGKTITPVAERFGRAQAAFDVIQKGEGAPNAIQDWHLVGPFALGFEEAFPPEAQYLANTLDLKATYQGLDGAEIRWKRINEGKPPSAGLINLQNEFQPKQSATAYAFTTITSDREQDTVLLTGSDDGIVVWLNGQKVQSQDAVRMAVLDQDRALVRLKKGENTLLVKVTDIGNAWGFYLRFADEFGVLPGQGITYPSGESVAR